MDIDGLVQCSRNFISKAQELLQSCTKPSIFEINLIGLWSSMIRIVVLINQIIEPQSFRPTNKPLRSSEIMGLCAIDTS